MNIIKFASPVLYIAININFFFFTIMFKLFAYLLLKNRTLIEFVCFFKMLIFISLNNYHQHLEEKFISETVLNILFRYLYHLLLFNMSFNENQCNCDVYLWASLLLLCLYNIHISCLDNISNRDLFRWHHISLSITFFFTLIWFKIHVRSFVSSNWHSFRQNVNHN